MRIAVLCPSDIAFRRFMPSLTKIRHLSYAGIGISTPAERYGNFLPDPNEVDAMVARQKKKAAQFAAAYGGKQYKSFRDVLDAPDVDAVYIPLPPAFHFRWAREALLRGKHVLLEKPAVLSEEEAKILVDLAQNCGLAIHENYMFLFHEQLPDIERRIAAGEIGEVRLYRMSFGFPRRSSDDFRYRKDCGGGALMDAGGYTIRCASRFLGPSIRVTDAHLNWTDEFDVDLYGSGTCVNDQGLTAQLAFGMDQDYRCELEVWGSKGTLKAERVFTAPADLAPGAFIKKNNETEKISLPTDDAFQNSILYFMKCTEDPDTREESFESILLQSRLVDAFKRLSGERYV